MQARAFLNKMMANKKITRVALEMNCRPEQIRAWLRGSHAISPRWARRLGVYFEVGPENFLQEFYEITEDGLSAEVHRKRLHLGLSLSEMSAYLGYAEKTIWNWEHKPIKNEKLVQELYQEVERRCSNT